MKKMLYSLLLTAFFFQNGFCQEYTFDSYYEYKTNTNGVTFFMINSTNSNYIFVGRSYSKEITGYIVDLKKVEFHYYTVTNIPNAVNFEYVNSRKIQGPYPDGIDKKMHLEYTITKIDSVKESVKIVKYKQRRKRKNLAEVELIYDENNKQYIFHNVAVTFLSHHLFDKREIEKINNRLPILISYDYYNGAKPTFKLTKKQKINTTLAISKENIKYIQ